MILKNMDAEASNGRGHPIDQGIKGEEQVAFYLKQEFVDDPHILIFHDLRLRNGNDDYAQTDHLVIDSRREIIWVAETKNYNGTLSCNRHGDWEVNYNGRIYHIESPTEQVKRHATSIKRFLKERNYRGFDIRTVVLLHPKMTLDRSKVCTDIDVIKSDNFVSMIRKHQQEVFESPSFTEDEIQQLASELLSAHRPGPFNRNDHQSLNSRPVDRSIQQRRQNRRRQNETSPGQTLISLAVIFIIFFGMYKIIPAVLNGLGTNLIQQAQRNIPNDSGTLVIRDLTGNPGTKQITAISIASGKTATASINAGGSYSMKLKPSAYRIEGSAGGYRVSFGITSIAPGKSNEIRIGDPQQFMQVIEKAG